MYALDTIAAVATPPGSGGVGIIRVSGAEALALGRRHFRSRGHGTFSPGRMYYGDFIDGEDNQIDTGLFVWFKSPHSFTGEDTVEFHCHGGIVLLNSLLRALFAAGARPAAAGEFSKRAFLNGKIDLAQAEAICDLVSAGSDKAAAVARRQFQGKLSATVERVREKIIAVLAWIEAEIDYPEADLDFTGQDQAEEILADQVKTLDQLANSYREGRIYREGVVTAILGSPNVGKSSLLNLLAGEERAIVTDIPGTTRDVLEVPVVIRGIPLRLADTAGIRESGDLVEQIGIERARRVANEADLILLILDTSRPLSSADRLLLEKVSREKTIAVLNKTDLPAAIGTTQVRSLGFARVREISALGGQGIEGLKDEVENMFISGLFAGDETVISNHRHYQALTKGAGLLKEVMAAWETMPLDLLALDLSQAWRILGEITGASWTEDLLDSIFRRFCLGK